MELSVASTTKPAPCKNLPMSWSLPTYDPCSGNIASISSAEPGGIVTSYTFDMTIMDEHW